MTHTVPGGLALAGCQDVRVAAELQRNLVSLLDLGTPTTVDCSAVDVVDTACVQLLLAAKRDTPDLQITVPAESETASWFRKAGVYEALVATTIATR